MEHRGEPRLSHPPNYPEMDQALRQGGWAGKRVITQERDDFRQMAQFRLNSVSLPIVD
jgi:hypothetical protein